MLLEGIVSFKCRLMQKQKENSREGITWSEMGKQNVQAEKVYCPSHGTETLLPAFSASGWPIENCTILKGLSGSQTRDLSHPKREPYH